MKKILLLLLFLPTLSFAYTYDSYQISEQLNVKSEIKISPKNIVSIKIGNISYQTYYILKQISETEFIISESTNNYYLNLKAEEAIFININNNYKIIFKNETIV